MKRRALALVEIIIALAVVIMAFFVLIQVFSSNYKYSTMSRTRSIAGVLAQSLMDEVESHPYGTPRPLSWAEGDETPAQVWIEGRPQDVTMHKKIEYTGGLDGTKPDDTDLVTITVSWREGLGEDKNAKNGDHQLVVKVPVWR
jgi:hypothetical protein